MSTAVESLERRLAATERKGRVVLLLWFGSFVLLAVLWVGSQQALSQASVLKARELDIVDPAGRTRLLVGLGQRGNGGLWFYDGNRKRRAVLGFSAEGQPTPQLVFFDEHEVARLSVAWDTRERPKFTAYDDNGKVVWTAP